MKVADLIVCAGQVVTCAGPSGPRTKEQAQNIGLIEDGAVAMVDGEVAAVGKKDQIIREWLGDRLELPGTSVIPGLVDCHCHPLWAGDRKHEFLLRHQGASYEEIHAAGGGIAHTVAATRSSSDQDLKDGMAKLLETCLAHGTTTLEAKSGYGLSKEEELRQLRLIKEVAEESPLDIVSTCLGAHALGPEFENDPEGYLKMIKEELLPSVKEQRLAEYVDVFCERGAFSCDESERVLRRAKELGFGLRLHAEEFSNLGGSRMAAKLGAVSCDHLQHLSQEDIPYLREAKTIATVMPGTSFFLKLDVYAPARKFWDQGLCVALGTDYNAGSCWTPSMQMAMSLAVLQMHMTCEEAITAATINAACTLGRENQIGSLEVGKQADLIILDVGDWKDALYRFGTNAVRAVIKKGIVLNTVLRSPLGAPL